MGGVSDAAKDYFAGLVSGVTMVLAGHPFDTVKVHLQTQNTAVHAERYRGALHCTSRILQTEGVKGLYKGATSSFLGVAVESSLLLGVYTQVKVALQGGGRYSPELSTTILAAATAGAGVSAVLCPTELVKVQVKGNSSVADGRFYSGPWDVVRKTFHQEGVRGLFRGLKATAIRESVGNTIFFTTYECIRFRMLQTLGGTLDSQKDFKRKALVEVGTGVVSGGCAGVAFWVAVLPLDVVKTRIQTGKGQPSKESILQLLHALYKEAGLRGLYAGLGPTLARAFPANAAAIVAWELTARLLGVGPSMSVSEAGTES